MSRTVVTCLLALSVGVQPAVAGVRDDQWIYREARAADGPTAVFLDWAFSGVLFRASCDQKRGELVLHYMGDGAVALSRGDRLAIRLGGEGRTFPMRTAITRAWGDPHALEGRLVVTPVVKRELTRIGELQIDAPNEMGEPWYVGDAEPLKRLIRACGESRDGL